MCEGIWVQQYWGSLLLILNAWHPDRAAQDWVRCLRSLPVGESDASERNSEQTVRLSWELLKLAKRNTKGRVCLKFFSFCSLGIFFMACKAVPMSDRVSKPQIHPNLFKCLASSFHNQNTIDAYSLNAAVGSGYRGRGINSWFNSFSSLAWFTPILLTSQQNVPTPLRWWKKQRWERGRGYWPLSVYIVPVLQWRQFT